MKQLSLIFLAFCSLSANAQTYDWTIANHCTSSLIGRDMNIDDNGNIYIVGSFVGTADFDPGSGTESVTSISAGLGDDNMYIQKLNSDGEFQWVKTFYSNEWGFYGKKIEFDEAQRPYIIGALAGTVDFDPGPGTYELTDAGGIDDDSDGFILKLDTDGDLIWVKAFGSSTAEVQFKSFEIDNDDNIFIIGSYGGSGQLNFGLGDFQVEYESFLLKMDTAGTSSWKKELTGINKHDVDIDCDNDGNLYILGRFTGLIDFEFGPDTTSLETETVSVNSDTFIQKIDSNGDFVWVKQIGGQGKAHPSAIEVDKTFENIYLTGYYYDTIDFDPGAGVHEIIYEGQYYGAFLAKLDLDGNFNWVNTVDSDTDSDGNAICTDEFNNVYLVGDFQNNLIPPFSTSSDGDMDIFTVKYNDAGDIVWFYPYGSGNNDYPSALVSDKSGSLLTMGNFGSTIDFNPFPEIDNIMTDGGYDMYLQQLIYDSSSVSINEQVEIGALLYPNPAKDIIAVSWPGEHFSLTIYDLHGRNVFENTMITSLTEISVTALKNGIYTAILVSENQSKAIQFSVNK